MPALFNSITNLESKSREDSISSYRLDSLLDSCADTYQLSQADIQKIRYYLLSHQLKLECFGEPEDANAVIAFSFGASECVNKVLAAVVDDIVYHQPKVNVFAQQEISSHLGHIRHTPIISSDYQSTEDVARYASNSQCLDKVMIVAQAWHADRCVTVCQALNIDVVGLRVVDYFPENDPQKWVRSPINWIIKESFREEATGFEISKRFDFT